MSLFTSLRKGFSFFLMSMGVSTYPKDGVRTSAPSSVPPPDPPKSPE